MITYVLAASSPTYPIGASVYHEGWAKGAAFKNGKQYHGITLPLGPDFGGPLFFAHYSFMGLDPRGLKDSYADYWGRIATTRSSITRTASKTRTTISGTAETAGASPRATATSATSPMLPIRTGV